MSVTENGPGVDPEAADRLTHEEREVMRLFVRGLLNKQIALKLNNSKITIKEHRGQVMHKMRAESVADLVRMAESVNSPVPNLYDHVRR